MLNIWTVYKNPIDYPGMYAARRFELDKRTDDVYVNEQLGLVRTWIEESARQYGVIPVRLERDPNDDPAILENWI